MTSNYTRTIDPADITVDDRYNAGHAHVSHALAIGDVGEVADAREYVARVERLTGDDRARCALFGYGVADALAGKRDYRFGN